MVMFKARFKPMAADKPSASAGERLQQLQKQQQQQPQPKPNPAPQEDEKAPPIEKEQGPQAPVKLPGPPGEPQRANEP